MPMRKPNSLLPSREQKAVEKNSQTLHLNIKCLAEARSITQAK